MKFWTVIYFKVNILDIIITVNILLAITIGMKSGTFLPFGCNECSSEETLTVDVPVQGHHACSLRTAERGVMQLVGQRGGHAGLRVSLRWAAVLWSVLFMPRSAVLKPNLWKYNQLSRRAVSFNAFEWNGGIKETLRDFCHLYDSSTQSCHVCQLLQGLSVRVVVLCKLRLHYLCMQQVSR